MRKSLYLWVAIFLTLLGSAKADTILGTPISNIPIVISKPGKYRLARNLTMPESGLTGASRVAIAVQANNVTIDMSGYSISESGSANTTNSTAISMGDYCKVYNGTISGFGYGVSGGVAFTAEDLTCESQRVVGIQASGRDARALRCRINNTSGGVASAGIFFGDSGVVEDCTISGIDTLGTSAIVFITADQIEVPGLNYADVVRHCVISNIQGGIAITTASQNTVIDDCDLFKIGNLFTVNDFAKVIVKNSAICSSGTNFVTTGVVDGGQNTVVP